MLRAEGITHAFAGRTVLRDISLSLSPGEVLGLHGPSGACKSTLARILSGALTPDAGRLTWDGAADPIPNVGTPSAPARVGTQNSGRPSQQSLRRKAIRPESVATSTAKVISRPSRRDRTSPACSRCER
jgi:ABC-type branched-subunit amino acid transport system ATPase component